MVRNKINVWSTYIDFYVVGEEEVEEFPKLKFLVKYTAKYPLVPPELQVKLISCEEEVHDDTRKKEGGFCNLPATKKKLKKLNQVLCEKVSIYCYVIAFCCSY